MFDVNQLNGIASGTTLAISVRKLQGLKVVQGALESWDENYVNVIDNEGNVIPCIVAGIDDIAVIAPIKRYAIPSKPADAPAVNKNARPDVDTTETGVQPRIQEHQVQAIPKKASDTAPVRTQNAPVQNPMDGLDIQIAQISKLFSSAKNFTLTSKQPEFKFPAEIDYISQKSIERVLSDILQRWNNYQRSNDPDRLLTGIDNLLTATEQYPDVALLHFNLGCFYDVIGRHIDAIMSFYRASELDNSAKHYQNIVSIAQRYQLTSVAYAAMFKYVTASIPAIDINSWRYLVYLSNEEKYFTDVFTFIQSHSDNARTAEKRIFFEALLYIADSNRLYEIKRQLYSILSQNRVDESNINSFIYSLQAAQSGNANEYKSLLERIQDCNPINIDADVAIIRNLYRTKYYDSALDKTTSLLRYYPNHPQLLTLQQEIASARDKQQETKPTFISQGKQASHSSWNNSVYYRAKDASDKKKDLPLAESLFRQAIAQGDHVESAYKDLAAVLVRQEKVTEALRLLEDYLPKASNKRAIKFTLINYNQKIGKYERAIALLNDILKESALQERLKYYKLLFYSYASMGDYDKSDETLRTIKASWPHDPEITKLHDYLKTARESGIRPENWQTSLYREESKLLEFFMDRCEFDGVVALKTPDGRYTERAARVAEATASDISSRTRKPDISAKLNLSAARVLRDIMREQPDADYQARLDKDLFHYCAYMGDHEISLNNRDAGRTYYAEAIRVTKEWDRTTQIKLEQFIKSYSADVSAILSIEVPVETWLMKALEENEFAIFVLRDLLVLTASNQDAKTYLLKQIITNKKPIMDRIVANCTRFLNRPVPSSPFSDSDLESLWEEASRRAQMEVNELEHLFQVLQNENLDFAAIHDHRQRIENHTANILTGTNKQRLDEICTIVEHIIEYSEQTDYKGWYFHSRTIVSMSMNLLTSIERTPTKISIELFYPYVQSLKSFIEMHFEQIQNQAEPIIKPDIGSEGFIDDSNIVSFTIVLSNDSGKSPVSTLTVILRESENYVPIKSNYSLMQTLDGGDKRTINDVQVLVTQEAREAKVFTLEFDIEYSNNRGEMKTLTDQVLEVRLYSSNDFVPFEDPFVFLGLPVEDDDMLFGRKQFVDRIVDMLTRAKPTTNFIFYGQKRSGKSSIAYAVRRNLPDNFIACYESLDQVSASMSSVGVLAQCMYKIASSLDRQLDGLAMSGQKQYKAVRTEAPLPDITSFEREPFHFFETYIRDVKRACVNHTDVNPHIIFILDEFTNLYNLYMNSQLPDGFMRAWKAAVETKLFSSIVIGQDFMPKFFDAFSNAFQAGKPERIGYLSYEDAREMIVRPLMLYPNTPQEESRVREDAVERLIELTAGNPFYLAHLCSRLVKYMHDQKRIYVSVAAIEQLKRDAIEGDDPFERNKFENLWNSGEKTGQEISDADALEVLREIARYSRKNMEGCPVTAISCATSSDLDSITKDLEDRFVIEPLKGKRYKIRVGLFQEWLLYQDHLNGYAL